MKLLLISLLFLFQDKPARFDPTGIWESESGTRYEFKLAGPDLVIKLIPGSNPQFVAYDLNLKNLPAVINDYDGDGTFVVKVSETKECKFDTHWRFTIVAPDRILGLSRAVLPDPETCAIKDTRDGLLDLRKQ